MALIFLKPHHLRLQTAALTAGAGGIVSLAMVAFGGSMTRYLPVGDGFHLAAVLGAGLAGLGLAPCFGRPGRMGWAIAIFGALAATLLGAVLGAGLIGLAHGNASSSGLGLIAILGAAENPIAVTIWGLTMTALHFGTARMRVTRAISP